MIGTIIVSILIIVMIVIVFIKTYTPDYIYLNLFHNKKYNIILQTLVLVIGISTIAILISLYSGEKLFEKVSGKFIETIALEEIKNENVKTSISLFGNNESKITADDIVDLYTVNLNTRLILLIYIVNMGCMVLATLISIFYVLKRKPNYIQW